MDYLMTLREAIESIGANKLRAVLTMLGIVIGVAAVVSMLAIGRGAQSQITSQIESIGANLLYVRAGGDSANPEPLTIEDASAIENPGRSPSVAGVAPFVQGNVQISVPGEQVSTGVFGVTPAYLEIQGIGVLEGSLLTAEQEQEQAAVVLLGIEIAETLFGTSEGLVGEVVRINGQPFRVVGVLEEAGGTTFGSSDNRVIIPLSTARLRVVRRTGVGEVDQILVEAKSSELVDAAIQEVSQVLRSRHTSNLGVDDFSIQNTQSFLETAESITGTLTVFLGSIAGVSLLVGGIGIMNIMLVSVIERTREIGLRKAVGARRRDIQIQFLIESSLMSIAGGIVGILLGWGISALVGVVFGGGTLNPQVDWNSVLLAVGFSATIGIFFGYYPASQAAKLEPVEALRSE
ncbi:MAG: FtsX-like permease family protein [Anaerolineae bacterium]|nr:MAG: FtsX-like permease family protein [Anaerolineae bacterium]